MLFSRNTLLADILRERPAVIGFLNASGLSWWDRVHLSAEEFCREAGLNPEEWLRTLEGLPPTPKLFDPEAIPLYAIADRLTADHRSFRREDVPAIERALDPAVAGDSREEPLLAEVRRMFTRFKRIFLAHMDEEELKIFPRALRLEARVCSLKFPPVGELPSLDRFGIRHGHDLEEKFRETATVMRRLIGKEGLPATASHRLGALYRGLESLEARLARHAEIETGLFFRRAALLEKRFGRALRMESPRS